MKFSSKIVIACPRTRVLELMRNPEYLTVWQPNVKGIVLLKGDAGQPGARSRVIVEVRELRLEMIETILELSLPDKLTSVYESRGVKNLVENRFYEEAPDKTRWVIDNTLEVSGMMSMVGSVVREISAKQTLASMNRFKAFAEKFDNPTMRR